MSDDISKMNYKQLRNEVQLLRDELAIMQRKFEDILYNLDDENFSVRFVKEKNNMKTSIEQTEESITLQAEKIDENAESIGSLKVTTDEIKSSVESVEKDVGTLSSTITQTAENIQMAVNASYSNPIKVTEFNKVTATKDQIYYESNTNLYWHYDGYQWISSSNANFGTVFEQTATGFKMNGNVTITEIAQVDKELRIGELGTNEQKMLKFNGTANIHTHPDGTNNSDGLGISAQLLHFYLEPENIFVKNPERPGYQISLEDYVSKNGGGGYAVFA